MPECRRFLNSNAKKQTDVEAQPRDPLAAFDCGPPLRDFFPHPSALCPPPPCILLFLWWVAPFLRRRKTRKIDRRWKNAVIGRGSMGLEVAGMW